MIIISPWIVNFRYLAYLEVCSAFGKVFFSMHLFILSVNGEVMYVYSETSLIELAGIRSGRVAISSDPFFIICCSIYLKATLRSTKESLSLDPNILWVVLVRCLFNSSAFRHEWGLNWSWWFGESYAVVFWWFRWQCLLIIDLFACSD